MKNKQWVGVILIIVALAFSFTGWYCVNKHHRDASNFRLNGASSFDSTEVANFYAKYPKLVLYKKQTVSLYQSNQYRHVWYDERGRNETAEVIYDKINNLADEGIWAKAPYKDIVDGFFQEKDSKPNVEFELFMTNYYFFYANKVLQGLDPSKTKALGWNLPRKKQSYVQYLDSLIDDPKLIDNKEQLIGQYYKLKSVLKKYRAIEKNGGLLKITPPTDFKSLKPGDSAAFVAQIRTRLFLTDDIDRDSKSAEYDKPLQKAVLKYKKRNGFVEDNIILPKHIAEMNVPIHERLRTIMVNMERCRWISTELTKAEQFIVVNIPAYRLSYYKGGKNVLQSNVVVGKETNETVIFSGMMSYIVFSPYWNVPKSIRDNEILPSIRKDPNYLAKNNMEWDGENVRQRPGPDNSLGLVKFLFPNNNNIYLHDSPAKALFTAETRALSHGCIRVQKSQELANKILEGVADWTPEKIHEAMNGGKEKWFQLPEKIPVYIGYFTAWVDEDGNVNFHKDIYDRDQPLAKLLLED